MSVITARVPLLGGVHDIHVEGGTIRDITASDATTDLCAGPTLFDIQVNGYGGRTYQIASQSDRDAVSFITGRLRRVGVGWHIPTVITDSPEVLAMAFRCIARALDEDPDTAASIPGLHLEGPYISPKDGPRGAHNTKHVRPPDWDEFQRLQELAGGRIRYVTLAPEIDGAIEFIAGAVAAGVRVSIGHTDLDRDSYAAAVDAGATLSTHVGNGAHDMMQRHNNYIWYQLAGRRTYASFVSDGHHLPDECLYAMIHAKGLDLSVITSDCVDLAGMPPGRYGKPPREVEKLPSGRIVLLGTPNLAGSGNNLLECVENLARAARLSHADAWRLATLNPARALGLDDRLGIEAGKEASLTLYRCESKTPAIRIEQTWVAGRKVYDAAAG